MRPVSSPSSRFSLVLKDIFSGHGGGEAQRTTLTSPYNGERERAKSGQRDLIHLARVEGRFPPYPQFLA